MSISIRIKARIAAINIPQYTAALKTTAIPLFCVCLLLLLPAAVNAIISSGPFNLTHALKQTLLCLFFFLIPLVVFYRNIKAYLYLLIPFILLSPALIFFIVFFHVRPRFELVALVMQTNPDELKEAAAGYLRYFIPFAVGYLLIYLYSLRKMPPRKVSFSKALSISLIATFLAFGWVVYEKELHRLPIKSISKYSLFIVDYYPLSLFGGTLEAYSILAKNKMKVNEGFTFGAAKQDTLAQRQIYMLVIGESSRYDRWQLNGYIRPTSPRLMQQESLLSYSDVVAGCNLTWMSVPQMITRAHPDSMDLQFSEKSILTAFREAGFKTAWLSNQSDQEIFWSGSILSHARTADVVRFSPSRTPNFEFEDVYDQHLLQSLDSLIKADQQNLFIVLHTMGNHWDYSRRYPPAFDTFKPSGSTVAISPPVAGVKEAISNTYDNSILYADYILDSAINTLKHSQAISSVLFLSDHGDDLFDAMPDQIDFHLNSSPATLHVPMFVWASSNYRAVYASKWNALEANKFRKVGPENTFYTLLDMANISILKSDSTKSVASSYFIDSIQKYYDNTERKAFYYSDFETKVVASEK